MDMHVVIVDYGMGNIGSVCNALDYLGAHYEVSSIPSVIQAADALLLPGVGSFSQAMSALRSKGIDEAIHETVTIKKRNILGICLGMQLMGTQGTEDGDTVGLGLIPVTVDRFSKTETNNGKIPHIGFNSVTAPDNSRLFQGFGKKSDFYFVHSYRMMPMGLPGSVATCDYGIAFLAAYEHENVFATQFHPEKSQTNGLMLLRNFLSC